MIKGMLSSATLNTISLSSVTKLFGFSDVGKGVVKSSLSGQYLQNIQDFLKVWSRSKPRNGHINQPGKCGFQLRNNQPVTNP